MKEELKQKTNMSQYDIIESHFISFVLSLYEQEVREMKEMEVELTGSPTQEVNYVKGRNDALSSLIQSKLEIIKKIKN